MFPNHREMTGKFLSDFEILVKYVLNLQTHIFMRGLFDPAVLWRGSFRSTVNLNQIYRFRCFLAEKISLSVKFTRNASIFVMLIHDFV